jgi:CubicO group peptidase (beta-lactamase class C family)
MHKTSRREFLRLASAAPLAFWALPLCITGAEGRGVFPAESTGGSPSEPYTDLSSLLNPIRDEHKLPALAAAAMLDGKVTAAGAVGLRKADTPEVVTLEDEFHIGSCTKAMTATIAGMLVEKGRLHWRSTLAAVFPERAKRMDQSFRGVTLELLLTHRSGAPANGSDYGSADQPMIQRRLEYMDSVIDHPPAWKPGGRFLYSNAGYVIAGAMLERVTGRVWEDLMKERIFNPLGMASGGFGPPSQASEVDQPWGHVWEDGRFIPRYEDNPAPLGPAGTVHCAILDYLRFADLHTSLGTRPRGLIKPETVRRLHRPPRGGNYAMGWVVVTRDWAKGLALTHAGSNTRNYFVVWLAPKIGLSLAVATNCAGPSVPQALDKVAAALVRRYAV